MKTYLFEIPDEDNQGSVAPGLAEWRKELALLIAERPSAVDLWTQSDWPYMWPGELYLGFGNMWDYCRTLSANNTTRDTKLVYRWLLTHHVGLEIHCTECQRRRGICRCPSRGRRYGTGWRYNPTPREGDWVISRRSLVRMAQERTPLPREPRRVGGFLASLITPEEPRTNEETK